MDCLVSVLSAGDVVVAVASYRRPGQLRDLLISLRAAGARRVVVVDNDPAGSAAAVCAEFDDLVRYVVEPEPGIAQARNRGLRELPPDAAAVVFVDDDETVEPGWLDELIAQATQSGADVVAGPVVSHFSAQTPDWVRAGGFLQRARYPTGPAVNLPATNNVLVRLAALRSLDRPWFDTAFSATGGSDTELFSRLRAAGATIHWADRAVVHEQVPGERITLRWLARREFRGGNVEGRLRLRHQSRPRVAGRGAAKIAYGLALVARAAAGRRRPGARELNQVFVGAGLIGSTTGRWVREYRRD